MAHTGFPYGRFSDIRVRSSEPMSYAYFNAHVARLCSNLEGMELSVTLQKASYVQWGTVRFATVEEILSTGGDAVMTNAALNDAFDRLSDETAQRLLTTGVLGFTKNYEFVRGEFLMGNGERLARKVTDAPDRVVFADVMIVPLGFGATPFATSRVDSVSMSAYDDRVSTTGTVNFVGWGRPPEYREFHAYYHRSGYIVCENGRYDESQRQVKVVWTLFMRKDD